MSGANAFGKHFVFTTFGESHGVALGAVIDGMPAGIAWDEALLARELERRRPGTSAVVSARAEADAPEVLSGVYEGKTLGTPIAVIVRNKDARSQDYKEIARSPRAGHADDAWRAKFGHSDPRGGGRSSGRETLARAIAGAAAQMYLRSAAPGLRAFGFARAIGPLALDDAELAGAGAENAARADEFLARFPSPSRQAAVETLLLDAKAEGKSYGGIAEIWIDGAPAGLGQPVFRKLKSDLAAAFLSVGATASVEIGDGFEAVKAEGSEFHRRAGSARYGGIRGGISTGERIVARVGFKPTSTVLDAAKKGRHDPCIVPRAIPVLEAMAWAVLADHVLWARLDRVGKG
jgi:chorismate synthase